MAYYTPLRYPGGKQKLFRYTYNLLAQNHICNCTYIEPFAGGAGLALNLLFSNVVHSIILNDVDRSIYAFWYSVLYQTDELCDLITNTEISVIEWTHQKEQQKFKETLPLLELGFSTFYLNRTNRSGIIKGGILGGKNQTGTYKIDCRFNKDELIQRIQRIATYRNKIHIYNLDAIDFIHTVIPTIQNAFVFFDPPYYKKGPGLYENHYTHHDHVTLSQEIMQINTCPWIVTYDSTSEINQMYQNLQSKNYSLNYSAQNRYAGTEVMFYSNTIVPVEFN